MEKAQLTAIILAGGKSSRMGSDKGLLELNKKAMVQYVFDAAQKVAGKIIIITNNKEYRKFGIPVFQDLIPDCGPIGGIYTGLTHSETRANLVLSCDIPLIKEDFLSRLTGNFRDESDALVPVHNNSVEPLCAVYHSRIIGKILKGIEEKEYKMQELLKKINTSFWNVEKHSFQEELFCNLNTPGDLEAVKTAL